LEFQRKFKGYGGKIAGDIKTGNIYLPNANTSSTGREIVIPE
jgi:hypothetical protein